MTSARPVNGPLDNSALPAGVRSRIVEGVNGLSVHVLEAGYEQVGKPVILLVHGFPELAYSWRKVMLGLASLGYHVIAYDQRGYGRTTGWQGRYEDDIAPFSLCRMAGDTVALLAKLNVAKVAAIIGHDFGSPVAGVCAMIRPDIFKSVVLMSAPFSGPPQLAPMNAGPESGGSKYSTPHNLHEDLAALARPRKHYQWYYSGTLANQEMWNGGEGVHAFLRNYYHHKSADWAGNHTFPLASLTAEELAKMPTYYIMDEACGMAETVKQHAPDAAHIAQCDWLSEKELQVYSEEYSRTGFQGGLQSYRCTTSGRNAEELSVFSGCTIDIPSLFVAGDNDWGVYQFPGELQRLETEFSTVYSGKVLIPDAGHWVQQEQPQVLLAHLESFLASL